MDDDIPAARLGARRTSPRTWGRDRAVHVHVRLPAPIARGLYSHARGRFMTVSGVVTVALARYLEIELDEEGEPIEKS